MSAWGQRSVRGFSPNSEPAGKKSDQGNGKARLQEPQDLFSTVSHLLIRTFTLTIWLPSICQLLLHCLVVLTFKIHNMLCDSMSLGRLVEGHWEVPSIHPSTDFRSGSAQKHTNTHSLVCQDPVSISLTYWSLPVFSFRAHWLVFSSLFWVNPVRFCADFLTVIVLSFLLALVAARHSDVVYLGVKCLLLSHLWWIRLEFIYSCFSLFFAESMFSHGVLFILSVLVFLVFAVGLHHKQFCHESCSKYTFTLWGEGYSV